MPQSPSTSQTAPGIGSGKPLLVAAYVYGCYMWGSTYMFTRIALAYWPPFLLTSTRALISFVILAAIIAVRGRRSPLTWSNLWPTFLFGVINGTGFAIVSWGQQYIPSAQTAVLLAVVPIFTMVIARLWLNEELTWLKAAAILLGFAGVSLAVGDRDTAGYVGTETQRLLGQAATVFGAFCYSLSWAVGKKYFRADPYTNTTGHMLAMGLYILILSLLFDPPLAPGAFAPAAIGSVLYLVLLGTALAYLALFYLIENISTIAVGYMALIHPMVAMILGVSFLGEVVAPRGLVGAVMVLIGVWLVNRPR